MRKKMNIFKRKLLSVVLAVSMLVPTSYTANSVSAADINNIGEPTYTVQKNASETDAFVYAYNVMDFGADNQGNNDNTEIFQKLLNKANELGGGIVYVPSGRYKVTGYLRIPKGVTLRGDWTKPVPGQPITSGTILMAYVGRGMGEEDRPFIEMEPETGCKDLTIWYPEQDPNNIVSYSPSICLGVDYYFGNEYSNVKNVTLLNSYYGVWWNRRNFGASPVLNGVYGTPLKKGVEIDCIADIGRIEGINFSPDYWSGSGMPNSPAPGSSFEDFIYENGVGIVMRRNDWSYTCYVNVDGYNIGYNTNFSYDGNRSTPNGHHYKFNLKNCKNGIVFDTTNYVGILFDDIKMYNCETGILVKGGTSDAIQFTNTSITASKYAINMDKTSSTKFLMHDVTIEKGVVNIDGGTLACTGSVFNNKAPQIVIGSLGRISLSGNTFKNGKQILNNSIYASEMENPEFTFTEVPQYPDEKAQYQGHMPSNLTLYDVTKAPYYASVSRNHGGGNDATDAIQRALNDAGANGGGIVFLPSGHYRINGTLTVPSNVELRGATDLSAVPHGSGAILEAYGNKGNPNGEPLIKISANAGVRGFVVNYPEQIYNLDANGEYHPIDYPFTMQGRGENVHVINVGIRAATGGLDLATYRCDNHYVDFLTGHVNKVCVKVGNGSKNGIINNLMFNTIVYACGQESKFGSFPNSPNGDGGPVYDQQLRDLEFLILGDCENQTLYNCFPYGAYIGVKFVNEGNGGPQNLLSMGLGVDGSRKALYFGSGLNGKMDFINSQIVSLNNDQPITRYFETEANSTFTANLYNTDLWGYPEKSVVMAANSGTLNLYTANFQFRGYNGAFNVQNGSNLNMVATNVNTHSSAFSTGSNNISLVSTVADYTTNEANAFAQNVSNFSTALEIDANQAANSISRDGWTATANPFNENAWQSLDGNLYSQWCTQSAQVPGQWYQVDMKKDQNFDLIVTTLGATNDVPRGYRVLVSNDGNNWREVASGENRSIYAVGDQTARYVRIEQTGNEGHWWAVYEFYVLKSSTYDVGEGEIIEDEEPTNPPVEEPTEQPTEEPTTEAETTDPTTIPGNLYTADDAEVYLSAIVNDPPAYNGRSIRDMHIAGSTFTLNNVYGGKNGGKANVLIHYATNYDNVNLGLTINNKSNYTFNCTNTYGWDQFVGTSTVQVDLNAGYDNTLVFGNASEGVNVDYIVVTPLGDVEDYVAGNIALGKSATSSGNENDTVPPELAFDGNIGSRWSSDYYDDANIIVDLEKNYLIDRIVLNWEAAYGVDYDIQVSLDGTSWTTVKSLRDQNGEIDEITFNAVAARYVKMQGVKRAMEYGYSLWEMEVYCAEEQSEQIPSGSISDKVNIQGFQISSVVKGLRVISGIEPEINGKKVVKTGNIYGINLEGFKQEDLVLGSTNPYVKNFDATNNGLMSVKMGDSETANYYAMTMINNGVSVDAYNVTYYVRAYAVLEDGTILYSDIVDYSIYKVADYLYKNTLMSNLSGHEYLYNDILKPVTPDYKVVDYNWGNVIVRP